MLPSFSISTFPKPLFSLYLTSSDQESPQIQSSVAIICWLQWGHRARRNIKINIQSRYVFTIYFFTCSLIFLMKIRWPDRSWTILNQWTRQLTRRRLAPPAVRLKGRDARRDWEDYCALWNLYNIEQYASYLRYQKDNQKIIKNSFIDVISWFNVISQF